MSRWRQRRLHLAAHVVGLAPALSTSTDPAGRSYDLTAMTHAARLLEEAAFDAVFEADNLVFDLDEAASIYTRPHWDATAVAAALAGTTSRIGLVTTASTTWNVPYALARQLQTIDLLSGGRLGWNAVTSFGGERQFGFDEIPDQSERHLRAVEFVEIVHGLWRGWQPGALTARDGGVVVDTSRIDRLVYAGEHLRADGAIGMPRSPQGWPVQWQAGASDEGLAFAGRYAEAIFSASPDLDHALAYAQRLGAAVAAQRGPEARAPLVFPGVHLVGGSTEREAREREAALVAQLDLEAGRRSLALAFGAVHSSERDGASGIELDDLDLDAPIPAERLDALPDSATLRRRRSRSELYRGLARRGLTVRELVLEHLQGHAHYRFTGSYDQIADDLQLWFDKGAADGFVVRFSDGAAGVHGFVEHVVPRLVDRGIFRREYRGSTLREHLGLPVPA